LALATNCCPGCFCESMQFVLTLACRNHKMSVEHAIKASTLGGAKALGLDDRGKIEIGKIADIQIWDIDNYEEVVYRLGSNVVETVIKKGKVVFKKGS
ncbi:MAG: amidohydrolase family protein, partial [Peptostreptococcaceae bacterium]